MSIDLSLDRVRRLFALLPANYTRPTIHIAGTNGKGSVTAILASIFTSSQISVGRFNSPHLLDVWDCITVNGCAISKDVYYSAKAKVDYVNKKQYIQATSFEILTAIAAQIFEEERVDIAIFEVGLGGTLDATNALPDHAILVSAITSVDLDHQQFLGNTPAAIARTKAGIVRPGKPCVLAPQKHPEVEPAVRDVVQAIGGLLVKAIDISNSSRPPSSSRGHSQRVMIPFPTWNTTLDLELPLLGVHQIENLTTAMTILSVLISQRQEHGIEGILRRITTSTLADGVLKTRWPGRLDYVSLLNPPLTLLVDGAHNAASAAALQSYLTSIDESYTNPSTRSSCTFILGLSHSPPRTPLQTLGPLLQPNDCVAIVHFSPVEDMPWVKNVPFSEVEDLVRSLVKEGNVKTFGHNPQELPLEPLRRALHWACEDSQRNSVILAGSLYLVSDLYRIAREQGTFL